MKRTCLAGALALTLSILPSARTGAEPRCYPTERFKVLDDQWVRDTLTKLVWQRQASANTMSWPQAQTYCGNAGLRLPTIKELRSIVDLATDPSGPTIDRKAFPNAPSESFWASSPNAGSSGSAWYVSFNGGVSGISDVRNLMMARCVR